MMFVLNMKLKNPKAVILSLFVASAVFISATAFFTNADFTPKITTATSDEIDSYSLRANDNEQRMQFFTQLGIAVDENTEICDSVKIPDSFNAVYEKYNSLQKKIGLDLKPYSGKTAERFTYKTKDNKNYVIILIYNGNIIGGHMTDGVWGSENYPLF